MTCSVPRWAPHTPPDTGASRTWTPLSLKAAWSFRMTVGEPVGAERHGLDLFRTGKGGEDQLARACEGLRAVRPIGAPVEVRLRCVRPHVVDDEGVAGLHEVQGHRPAHVP